VGCICSSVLLQLKSATQGTMLKEPEDDIKNIRGCFVPLWAGLARWLTYKYIQLETFHFC
jgi:hypothetical protein